MNCLFPSCTPLNLVTTALAIATLLAGCSGGREISSSASYNPGYGPFDQNGNYVEAWADKPARQHRWAIKPAPAEPAAQLVARKDPPVPANQKKPTEKRPPLVASQAPPSRPAPAVQPKPRPASPKPASKPTIRHTVVKGNTLYSLGRRYGTSVGAIQRANGISGTTIRIGQKLRIPR